MKKILLVDDDQDLVFALATVLSSKGFKVETAGSRLEGMEKVVGFSPDLVILDVNMETPSAGFEMNRQMRTNPELRHIPIIMLTGIDVMNTGNLVVDMYRSMRGTPGFDENLVLKVKGADGTVGVDFRADNGAFYWLPLDSFLSKPVENDQLIEEVNKFID